MLAQVDALHLAQPRVGTRKLHDHLATVGLAVGRDRLFTVLRESRRLVKWKRRGTQTTYAGRGCAVAPNRLKALTVTAPRQVVVSDITYLRLARGAFAYLFLVTDLASRTIVGWHVSRDLSHHAALIALDAAAQTLGPVTGIVHHSDRGSQYCCHAYLLRLHALRMLPCMTDDQHCDQNAVAERVNGILKDEFDLDAEFPSVTAAQHAVAEAVTTTTRRARTGVLGSNPRTVFQHTA